MEEVKGGAPPPRVIPELGSMKKGDYMIHVYIQEGKQFKVDQEETCDPIIEILCLDKKKFTTVKTDVGPTTKVYWGEHVFFEPKNLSQQEIEGGQIQIRILHKGWFKQALIGVYEFDLSYIYFQPKHAILNQWLGLSNPESRDFNEISSYLKLSISICGTGDEQITLNDQEGPDQSDEIMMPPQIKKDYKQIKFKFIKSEKLPKTDDWGTIDPYFYTKFLSKTLKTTIIKKANLAETTFDEEFWLPVQWPCASDRIVIKLMDQNDMKSHETIGSLYFSLKEIIAAKEGQLVWKNLYGAPIGASGQDVDLMNDNPEGASTWKGRILMHLSAEDIKSPALKVIKVESVFKEEITKQGAFEQCDYEIMAEIGQGICLPESKNYKVKIAINDFQTLITPDPKEAKTSYNRWSHRFEATGFKAPYKSMSELGYVYIYLMDGDQPICFWRGTCSDFTDINPSYKWIPLINDMALEKVTESQNAGLIQIKLSINKRVPGSPALPYKTQDAWKKPPPKRIGSWKVRCFIFQCKDIPAADDDGASDPFIRIWNPDGKVVETRVIEDNLNPIFYQALEIDYNFDQIADAPPIVLNVMDKDLGTFKTTDDYLGRAVVYLNDASVCDNDSIPVPKWHDIKIGFRDSEPASGQMLLSFSVVYDDFSYQIPINYLKLAEQIQIKEFNVDINVLGLRRLESFGLLPIRKAFVRFNLRSLLPPEKADAVTNIKTSPCAPGRNPNINTLITFGMDLPMDPLYCPKLQCDVFDYVYKGFSQPLVGTFTIAIGDIMQAELREREHIISHSNEIIIHLKTQLGNPIEEEHKGQSNFSINNEVSDVLLEFPEQKDVSSFMQQQSPIKEERKSEASQKSIGSKGSPQRSPTKMLIGGGGMSKSLSLKPGASKEMQQQIQNNLRIKLQAEKENQKEINKQELEQRRQIEMQHMKTSNKKAYKNVIIPEYKMDERLRIERECNPPPSSLYIGVGYNTVPADKRKHYRRFYDDELENVKEIFSTNTFIECPIMRGQSRGLKKSFFSWFSSDKTDDSGQVSNIKQVGKFKGRLNIQNKDEMEAYNAIKKGKTELIVNMLQTLHQKQFGSPMEFKMDKLETHEGQSKFKILMEKMGCDAVDVLGFMKEQSYGEQISRMLLQQTKCIVRVYMLDGSDLASRDIGSASDPYLILKCGKKVYSEKDNYQLDQKDPQFFKCYDFDAEFPGAPPLVIKAMDYDDLFGDDLIGKTVIDLDDRFFSPEWNSIEEKPIETRQLWHKSSTVSQGLVRCWIDIIPQTVVAKADKIYNITPRPPKEFEVRLIVWDTKGVKSMDFEDTSDVFIKAFIDSTDKKETDTHYRCSSGEASFNYRLLFKIKAPRPNTTLTLQLWDRDLLKSNEFIGDAQLNIVNLLVDAFETNQPMTLTKKYYDSYLKSQIATPLEFQDDDSFFVGCKGMDEGVIKENGRIRISLAIVPVETSEKNPVGSGRSDPNINPFLPPPIGRFSFSWNPFSMLLQLIGPAMKRKLCLICCLVFCVALCIASLPMIFSDIISKLFMKMFGG